MSLTHALLELAHAVFMFPFWGQAAREAAGREAALAADVERLQHARRAAASAAEPSAAVENGAHFSFSDPDAGALWRP